MRLLDALKEKFEKLKLQREVYSKHMKIGNDGIQCRICWRTIGIGTSQLLTINVFSHFKVSHKYLEENKILENTVRYIGFLYTCV